MTKVENTSQEGAEEGQINTVAVKGGIKDSRFQTPAMCLDITAEKASETQLTVHPEHFE